MDQSSISADEVPQTNVIKKPVFVRVPANLFSYFFHPLFIPVYATWYLAFIHPYYFVGFEEKQKVWVLLRVALNMVFFPVLTIVLLKAVGFIDSVFLKTQKDRVIPYIAVGIFFFWMFLVFRNQEIPTILTSFIFSAFISSSVALIANIYFKISMHAIGAGGLLGLMLIVLFTHSTLPIALPLMITILISGIVCTSRMIVSDHTPADIYFGLFVGIFCQFIGAAFII